MYVHMFMFIYIYIYICIYIYIYLYAEVSLYASKNTRNKPMNFASMKCDDTIWCCQSRHTLYVYEKHQPLVTSFPGMKRMKRIWENQPRKSIPVTSLRLTLAKQIEIPDTVVAKGTMFRSRRPMIDRQNQ